MKIVVLCGGLSNERDVSLKTGEMVSKSLIRLGHDVLLLDLYLGVSKISNIDDLFVNNEDDINLYNVFEDAPSLEILKKTYGDHLIGDNVIELCKYADFVFMGLHGSIGENGKLQALFDVLNIKYTGCNSKGSMIAMDKILTKELLSNNGILTPKWSVYDSNTNLDKVNFPCVLKVNDSGSSVGVFIVNDRDELILKLEELKKYDSKIMIEEYINGREFSIGILGDVVLPPIEIIPNEGFYDYKNKYQVGLTKEVCPALISSELESELKSIAMDVFKTLNLTKYARIDFILCNNKFYCLEANTLPGMTKTSLLPQEALAMGISYDELVDKICNL